MLPSAMENRTERLHHSNRLTIILQRHGLPDKKMPDSPTEMNGNLGWLTPEGIEITRNNSRLAIERLAANYKDTAVDFIFLNSPAKYLGQFGMRAQQTAEIAANELITASQQNENLNLLRLQNGLSRPVQRLNEFQISDDYLRDLEGYFEGNFWELYYNMDPKLDEYFNNHQFEETPIDISQRIKGLVKRLDWLAKFHAINNPNRKLVVWGATHGDVLRSFVQYGLKGDVKRWRADYSEILQLDSMDNGIFVCNFQGSELFINI